MTKNEWLNEIIFVDIYGRPYNLSDVPMTTMKRKKAFKKSRTSKKEINIIWKEIKHGQSNGSKT
jgi:hypothetical protein